FRDTLYAAGDFIEGTDTCAIARFSNLDWEVVLKPLQQSMDYFDGTTIRQLLAADNQLFCAGKFSVASLMIYGNNLMKFDRDNSGLAICTPLLIVDSGINTMAVLNNTICFGGEFIASNSDTLNHIAVFANSMLGIEENQM